MIRALRKVEQPIPEEFTQASHHYESRFDADRYRQRTMRNHFWLGGPEGQRKLRDLKVGVAGLGGMGSQIAELLVRLGVGHLRIADPDHIEATNLNRQVIANRDTLGVSKAKAAAQELRRIADDYELVVYDQGITDETAAEFVRGCDVIIDEIDVFPLDRHVLLHREARRLGLPLYSAYAVGLGIHFYKFHGDEYTFEDFLNCPPEDWKNPTADLILDRFGQPFTSYLDGPGIDAYREEIATTGAPIFGPATLLGQSVVVTRMVCDLIGRYEAKQGPTPVMPEFLVLDPVEMSFRKARMKP